MILGYYVGNHGRLPENHGRLPENHGMEGPNYRVLYENHGMEKGLDPFWGRPITGVRGSPDTVILGYLIYPLYEVGVP